MCSINSSIVTAWQTKWSSLKENGLLIYFGSPHSFSHQQGSSGCEQHGVIITGLKYTNLGGYTNEGRQPPSEKTEFQISEETTAAVTYREPTTLICTDRIGDIRAS